MYKRGQFFLIAAVVIVGILASLAAVYNVANAPTENTHVYDLSSAISYEGAQTLNSGVFNAVSPNKISQNLQNLTSSYATNNPDLELYTIYGNRSSLQIINNTCVNNGYIGWAVTHIQNCKRTIGESTLYSPGGSVDVKIGGEYHHFDLRSGQNFFIILKKQIQNGGHIVASNDYNKHDGWDNNRH